MIDLHQPGRRGKRGSALKPAIRASTMKLVPQKVRNSLESSYKEEAHTKLWGAHSPLVSARFTESKMTLVAGDVEGSLSCRGRLEEVTPEQNYPISNLVHSTVLAFIPASPSRAHRILSIFSVLQSFRELHRPRSFLMDRAMLGVGFSSLCIYPPHQVHATPWGRRAIKGHI